MRSQGRCLTGFRLFIAVSLVLLRPFLFQLVIGLKILRNELVDFRFMSLLAEGAAQPLRKGFQCPGDRVGRRGQKPAQDQGHQLSLTGRQGIKIGSLEIIGDEVIESLFRRRRIEFLRDGDAIGIFDVFQDLTTQGSFADGLQTLFKIVEIIHVGQSCEPALEAFQISEGVIVDDADQTIKLQEGILQRRSRQEQLRRVGDGGFDGVGDLVGIFIDVPQSVRLVNDHEIPLNLPDIGVLGPGKLIGTQDDFFLHKRVQVALLDFLIERLRLQDEGGQKELVQQFLIPLLAEIGRQDDQDFSFSFRPFLGDDNARLDGLSQTYFIGENGAFGQGRAESKEGSLNLMRVEIDLGVGQGRGQFFKAVRGTALGQLEGEVFSVVGVYIHEFMKSFANYCSAEPRTPLPAASGPG